MFCLDERERDVRKISTLGKSLILEFQPSLKFSITWCWFILGKVENIRESETSESIVSEISSTNCTLVVFPS